ncbi:MAG TPA: hypothetical protein VEA19_02260 [Actinomycetota bacterium]|nr:hypothetical protein [Actinomycetota bacterium]
MDTGQATVTAGDYTEEMTLQVQGYVYGNGSFTGAWSKLGSGGFLNVTSAEGTGTFPTSATTTLGVRVSPGAVSETIRINSSDGRCTVTIDRVGPDGVEGSFECSAEGVSGQFSAG